MALKEREARFASVTTNQEYDALQLEVEALRSSIATHEARLLRLVDEIARTSRDLAAAQAEATELRQELEDQVGTRQSEQVTIDSQLKDLEIKRSAMKDGIDAELLALYERTKGRRGIRVAAVRRSACGCCFQQLPPQLLSEARRSIGIILCDNWGGLVAWDDESG